jgi:thioredoxin-like negative regulator of GroEL
MTGLRPISICLQSIVILSMVGLAGCGSPETKAQNYYDRGMALIAKNDDLNARLELLNAVKYKSDKVEAWRALAGIDERTKAQSLFTDLRRIVELDPNDLDARLKLARIMVTGGAAEAALKMLDVAKEGDTPNANLHALRAAALAGTKDPAGALKEAQRGKRRKATPTAH